MLSEKSAFKNSWSCIIIAWNTNSMLTHKTFRTLLSENTLKTALKEQCVKKPTLIFVSVWHCQVLPVLPLPVLSTSRYIRKNIYNSMPQNMPHRVCLPFHNSHVNYQSWRLVAVVKQQPSEPAFILYRVTALLRLRCEVWYCAPFLSLHSRDFVVAVTSEHMEATAFWTSEAAPTEQTKLVD